MRGRKISKFRFLDVSKHGRKIFPKFEFSDFLGIKSEISQYDFEYVGLGRF